MHRDYVQPKPGTAQKLTNWKKPQWDSDCLTHTDQSFQPTTQVQPDGLKADYAFKLSDHVYFTSI